MMRQQEPGQQPIFLFAGHFPTIFVEQRFAEWLFFVGGGNLIYESMPSWSAVYSNIDIYDGATNQWTTDHSAQPWIEGAVLSAGNKLIVAGGFI